jgi:endonuclease YncB( thermonuclease family)
MKKSIAILRILAAGLFAAAMLPAAAQEAKRMTGTSQETIDGDDFVFQPETGGAPFRVRLCGVDAPELNEPHGQQAQATLSLMLANRKLILYVLPGLPPIKVYESKGKQFTLDRQLAVVRVDGENESVNLQLILKGYARHMYLASSFCGKALPRPDLDAAETSARSAGLGMWTR